MKVPQLPLLEYLRSRDSKCPQPLGYPYRSPPLEPAAGEVESQQQCPLVSRDSTGGAVALRWQEGKMVSGLGREAELRAEVWEGKLGTFQEFQGCPLHGLAGVEGPGLEAPRRVTHLDPSFLGQDSYGPARSSPSLRSPGSVLPCPTGCLPCGKGAPWG